MFLGNTGIVCYPVSLWQLQSVLERNFTCIHLSNVLTDYFSNSLSEKTTNDIPMKFAHCHFKTTFYRMPLSNRGINLQIIHVRRKAIFKFHRTCIACVNIISFQIGYFTRHGTSSHTKKPPENTVRFVTMLCSTLF